jgi:hypothetical protein
LAWLRRIGIVDLVGVAADFSDTATFALLYMIVIVLVSTTGNSAAGFIAALCLPLFRASVWINAAEDVVAVAAFAMRGMVIANPAAPEHAGSLRATVVCRQPVNGFR